MSRSEVPGPSSHTIRTFRAADAEPLAALLRAALASGEQDGNSSEDFEGLIGALPIVRHLLVADIDGVAVGMISPDHHLVQVDPAVRRQGLGRALVEHAETSLDATGDGPLILFPPHGNMGANAFLTALGYGYDHSLWRLQLRNPDTTPLPHLPADVRVQAYDDALLERYVDLINSSFADHPTPLRVTAEQIRHVHASPKFDPEGIAILCDPAGTAIGFCTTGANREQSPSTGTLRLIGVRPEQRHRGLGRWLLRWGIDYLHSTGVETIELSVESQNDRALDLYRSVGFEPVEEWPQWTSKRGSAPTA